MERSGQLHVRRNVIIEQGAFGMMTWEGTPLCLTLERTYPEGPRGVQMVKIPPGEYQLVRRRYNKGGYDTWHVIGGEISANRLILIHKGNREEDSDGCILVGIGVRMQPTPALTESGIAHSRLMAVTAQHDELKLIISNCP